MRPFEANGQRKPLGEWTFEEINALAEEEPLEPIGGKWPVKGPLKMLRDEMKHFDAKHVADLAWQAVVTHATMLRLASQDEAEQYVRDMMGTRKPDE